MSQVNPPNPTAVNIFHSHFGTLPGSQDARAECEKWQRLCDELLAERERLRTELEQARLDNFCKGFKLEQTMEEVYAEIERETTIDQLIADFESRAGHSA